MSLYTKHRPKTLDEVVGNESTVRGLRAVLDKDDKPHAFLFAGPSGCGKTTLARIVARSLGCSDEDFCEMDTADFRGIDSMREIRRRVGFAPMEGPVRVWLLDECHQITNDGQEALLKALEDTPDHAYFCLCTTVPEKLKKTIQNRCTRYDVEELSPRQIWDLLVRVCKAERIRPSKDILKHIAKSCMGSARASLVALEQVIDLSDEDAEAVVSQVMDREIKLNKLCQALLKGASWSTIREILRHLEGEPESLRRGVLGYMRAVLLNQENPQAYRIMDCFGEPYYNVGNAGLVMSCWEATFDE